VSAVAPAAPELAARARAIRWYHTIDLAPGLTTAGHFDTRPSARTVPLPARLDGLRCLDVGTWDGFWAFEMERRGAASVTAIDIEDPRRWDWPAQAFAGPQGADRLRYLDTFKNDGAGFRLAAEALGSQVRRVDRSVYELDPAADGPFDLAFIGSLLLHLRDPVAALDAIRRVLVPGGTLVLAETVELLPSLLRPRTPTARLEGLDESWWWQPNVAAVRRMVRSAGFGIEQATGLYFIPLGASHPRADWRSAVQALGSAAGRERVVIALRGLPHTAVRARRIV
jgi:tRNA (mo5U34)-methyltransferase